MNDWLHRNGARLVLALVLASAILLVVALQSCTWFRVTDTDRAIS